MLSLLFLAASLAGTDPAWPSASGVYPHLAARADSYSECGIGVVVPWADRLWYVSYVAHMAGSGVGLFEIDNRLNIRQRPESIPGTHAGRMVHRETSQLVVGPYVIDAQGHVRVFERLARGERVTAIARHLFQPAQKVYFQCMEGNYYEGDLRTLELKLLGHAGKELGVSGRWHFKGAYTSQGRYVVANNSYFEEDTTASGGHLGRLAEWDGHHWKILQRTAFCDVTTRHGIDAVPGDNSPLWATGWDKRSVILAVLADGQWRNYRLPKGSGAYDQAWCTEWPRIRAVESGQWMLDMHGLFYHFPPDFRPGHATPPEPFAYHLRMTPDFCAWRDRLVLAGNENSSMGHSHRQGGQPQSNLWFGTIDELRTWGRPGGWAALWLDDPVHAGTASDPMLIGGLQNRSLHLLNAGKQCRFTLQVDRDGTDCWTDYKAIDLPAAGHASIVLPADLSAAWMRILPSADTTATAQFVFMPEGVLPDPQPGRFAAITPAVQTRPRVQGAMVSFARRLWLTPYLTGADGRPTLGLGLYEVDQDLKPVRRPESVPGVFANRIMLGSSSWLGIGGGLLSIGPHLIDAGGHVRTFAGLAGREIVASLAARTDARQIHFLTADGRLLCGDPGTMQTAQAADLAGTLKLSGKYRFKAGFQSGPMMFVTAVADDGRGGLLAESDGHGWKVVDRAAYAEVADLASMNSTVVATGWDRASALVKLREPNGWVTYRLPKADDRFEQALCAGLPPRIREVETERLLVDVHGIAYESTGLRHSWFLRPIATHGRLMSDFASFRGLTVLAGSDANAPPSANCLAGPGGVRLWVGKTDDLWQLADPRGPRRPRGVGGPWLDTPVRAGVLSDPYLMTNFVDKRVELSHDAPGPVRYTILVDAVGDRQHFAEQAVLTVEPGRTATYRFPAGFGAHWARLKVDRACKATAHFIYE